MRRWGSDRNAVSSVLGGILLFSLFILVLIRVQTVFVPVWEEDAEARHAEELLGQFASFKAQADRQVEPGVAVPSTVTFQLERQGGFRFFSPGSGGGGSLSLHRDAGNHSISSPELTITNSTELVLIAASETWNAVQNSEVENVTQILSLRLRLDSVDASYEDDFVTITITDANNQYAGDLRALIQNPSGPDWQIEMRTRDRANNVLFQQPHFAFPNAATNSPFWIDALDPPLRFDQVLAAADRPLALTLTTTSASAPHLTAKFSVTYMQETAGGGTILVGGGQQTITNFLDTSTNGRLEYAGAASNFVRQDIVYEYGGVLLAQEDGAVMAIPPAMTALVSGGTTAIDLTLPAVSVSPQARPAGTTASVTVQGSNQRIMLATGPRLTFGIGTDHPEAWTAFWRGVFESAGLAEAAGHFTVSSTPAAAWFTIEGTAGGSSHDVHFVLHHGTATLVA